MFDLPVAICKTRSALPKSAENLAKLWLYRAMVKLDGKSRMIGAFGWESLGLVHYLGVDGCVDEKSEPVFALLESRLGELLAQFEHKRMRKAPPAALEKNVERLGKALRLSPTARKLLCFTLMMQNVRRIANGMEMLANLSTSDLYHSLSMILGVREGTVRRELSHTSPLVVSGLLTIKRREHVNLKEKLNTLPGDFAERMMIEAGSTQDLFEDVFFSSPPATLDKKDFAHMQAQIDILFPLLQSARKSRLTGINILIYGPPGVGKTEFARILARETASVLHEVASADREGEPIDGEARLGAYRVALNLLGSSKNLLVFDEAEDIFGRGDTLFAPPSVAQSCKAWMNQTLENNQVPTIWLTNAIKGIDPAFIRRFTMVFAMPPPPRNRMRSLVREIADDMVPEAAIARIADAEHLTPAVVTRAANVLRTVHDEFLPAQRANALRLLIDGVLVAQGHAGLPTLAANDTLAAYAPEFVAADANLNDIAAGIRRSRRGRLCLYGPPGTGKTAFGRWLAEEIGAPLHVKRISDILSPYVGMSEQGLAEAFRSASEDRAVLMLDEVDSFLQDRNGARHSWEVTQVNEMLTQMEAFEGVFIASTNLMDNLDPAAIRRFDLKIRFGYLHPAQACGLLESFCRALGLATPGAPHKARLSGIGNLTPGDFATVARRHCFSPIAGPGEFIEALLAEARLKKDGRIQSIGFVANG
ncbi:ATP-binding protein [Dechloromonas sp. H13]|uniref:AAA family ATPase n=1 Tax=Dechloromonas sp. H13 TaxID=2570193 RepID=UPI00188525D7|nr:ATP-binding protein [Dechloromonas sp. H13]